MWQPGKGLVRKASSKWCNCHSNRVFCTHAHKPMCIHAYTYTFMCGCTQQAHMHTICTYANNMHTCTHVSPTLHILSGIKLHTGKCQWWHRDMCVCTCVRVCTCRCACGDQRTTSGFSQELSLCFWGMCLSLLCCLPSRLGWLTVSPNGLLGLYLCSVGL